MRYSLFTALAAVSATAALIAAPPVAGPAVAQQFTMKIGTATPQGDQNTWMAWFKQRVEKRAKGRYGVGVRFVDVTPTARRAIRQYVQEATK